MKADKVKNIIVSEKELRTAFFAISFYTGYITILASKGKIKSGEEGTCILEKEVERLIQEFILKNKN